MISKQHKLSTKEINYLLRRKQTLYVGGYKILWCDQYPNKSYHQTGIQLSAKIHKSSVKRNTIRRAYLAARQNHIANPSNNHYYKLFVIIHPDHCEEIHKIILDEKKVQEGARGGKNDTQQKSPITNTISQSTEIQKHPLKSKSIHGNLEQHFSQIIISTLGKLTHPNFKTGSPKQNHSGKR